MKKIKAFTLVELLVVISIIALLLAVLIPSLNKAKEIANRLICGTRLKTIGMANLSYANIYNGYFCPVSFKDPSQNFRIIDWVSNRAFRKILNIDSYGNDRIGDENGSNSLYAFPKEYLCPSDKISINKYKQSSVGEVFVSYSYNMTDWGRSNYSWNENFDKQANLGHKISRLPRPAEKLAFIDGIDWWTSWGSANYKKAWDKLGQAPNQTYRDSPYRIYGAVFYRHSQGAVISFYDGHTAYMKKEKVYSMKNFPGMWIGDLERYCRYNPCPW